MATRNRISGMLGLAAAAMLTLASPSGLAAQTKVYPYPGDPSWFPMDRFWSVLNPVDNMARITGNNPFDLSAGDNGSLQLNINGGASPTSPGFFDWAFYGTLSGSTPWGQLGNVSDLSMDWWRSGPPVSAPAGDPWAAQTPVLRLLLGNESGSQLYGELVWEKFYTDNSYVTSYDQWVPEDLIGQNFWRSSGGGSMVGGLASVDQGTWGTQYLVNSGCQNQTYPSGDQSSTNWNGGLVIGTVGQWADLNFCSPDLASSYVWGLAVGIGSRWPAPYEGYVDYVRLGFDNGEGGTSDAVYANFELPETTVPEPGSLLLLGTGLLGLGGAVALRRKRG